MPNIIQLTRKDIKKIEEILDNYPELNIFKLTESDSNGIGTTLEMEFDMKLSGLKGKFNIEISGVENW